MKDINGMSLSSKTSVSPFIKYPETRAIDLVNFSSPSPGQPIAVISKGVIKRRESPFTFAVPPKALHPVLPYTPDWAESITICGTCVGYIVANPDVSPPKERSFHCLLSTAEGAVLSCSLPGFVLLWSVLHDVVQASRNMAQVLRIGAYIIIQNTQSFAYRYIRFCHPLYKEDAGHWFVHLPVFVKLSPVSCSRIT